jgi:hypothetical protein
MTQDRIEQAARECVDAWHFTRNPNVSIADDAALIVHVAALIRREREDAARVEREQCAKVCLDLAPHPSGEEIIMSTSRWIVTSCASAIRARGGE